MIKTPKLYFVDTGLAARLLGVQDANQLLVHPLRGELFETWVVSELLKGFNQGRPSNLYFWRDHIGNEIDVLIENTFSLNPIEIKSAKTITSEALHGVLKWQELAEEKAGQGWLVYGGSEQQYRQGIQVLPWNNLKKLLDEN